MTRLSEIASRMICPDNISHEEPDSLELIEADTGKGVCDYFAEQDGYKCDCHGVLYNDCRQHMMLDLLRRQREVLARSSVGETTGTSITFTNYDRLIKTEA